MIAISIGLGVYVLMLSSYWLGRTFERCAQDRRRLQALANDDKTARVKTVIVKDR